MDSDVLKEKFIEFFKQKQHKEIPNVSLIPEHDPTVLFTTAGMHPLIPFLLGQSHAKGKRLTNIQKCLRTDDIDEIGDDFHLTFFEMLGSWSLGDYFKEDAIKWSWEFLTDKKWLGLDKDRLYVSVFAGDKDAPRDEESARVWASIGVPKERIFYLPKKDNWWGPAGDTGPCGPDTEMFYDTGKKPHGKDCKSGDGCGKYIEIWNDVFMQYDKIAEGKFEMLKQKNVDTGMGVERTVAALEGKKSVYEIETFKPIVEKIKELAKDQQEKSVRIIADHIKASTFILAEKIQPSNVERGYVLRRLLRRAIRHGKLIGVEKEFLSELAEVVIEICKKNYPHLVDNKKFILDELKQEDVKFRKTLEEGMKKFEQIASREKRISGPDAFLLFQSFGFPIEITKDMAKETGVEVDEAGFEEEYKKHQELSRVGAGKKFKG